MSILKDLHARARNIIAIYSEPRRARPMPQGMAYDDLYAAMESAGVTYASAEPYTETDARSHLRGIWLSGLSPVEKYDLFYALDVKVQNQCERGLASEVTREIAEKQYLCIKEMERGR